MSECPECGAEMPPGEGECPTCGRPREELGKGDDAQDQTDAVAERGGIAESHVLVRRTEGQVTGVVTSSQDGEQHDSVRGDEAKSLVQRRSGRKSEGESDNPTVARRLLEHLPGDWMLDCVGGSDDLPPCPEDYVDFEAHSDEGKRLKAQVTRVLPNDEFLTGFNVGDGGRFSGTVEDVIQRIREAIESKKHVSGLDMTLVLDATRFGVAALASIPGAFRARHGLWASRVGFEAIWLVGPNASTTSRLD